MEKGKEKNQFEPRLLGLGLGKRFITARSTEEKEDEIKKLKGSELSLTLHSLRLLLFIFCALLLFFLDFFFVCCWRQSSKNTFYVYD